MCEIKLDGNIKDTLCLKPITIKIAWFHMLDSALKARRINSADVFGGEEKYQALKKSKEIDFIIMRKALYDAVDLAGDYKIVFEAADYFDPVSFGTAGVALYTAPTMKSFLKLYSDIYMYFGTVLRAVYKESPNGDVELWILHADTSHGVNADKLTYLGLLFYCSVLMRFIRLAAGEPKLRIGFKMVKWYLPIDLIKEFEREYHCRIDLGHKVRRVVIDKQYLELPLKNHDEKLHRIALDETYKDIEKATQSNIITQVYNVLDALNLDVATPNIVASAMNTSSRTLSRRLLDEGLSFRKLLERYKLEKALRLFQEDKVNMTDVAFALGFSDLSSFSRAFKRWTGLSPTEVMQRNKMDVG